MKIGLLYPSPDPLSPANWSGSPYGLATGLEACGIEVIPIGAKLPFLMHYSVAVLSRISGKRGAVAERTFVRLWSRTRYLSRNVAQHAAVLDGVIAMGLELFDLAAVREQARVPFVTFDDGTLEQQWRNPSSDIRQSNFREDEVVPWFGQQAMSARAATACCVSTNYAAKSFVEDYGVLAGRVRVVGMGHRARHGLPTGDRDWSTPRFLFVGVDWERKNGDAVLAAFAEVRGTHSDATLDIVGRHPRIDRPGVRDHGFLAREDPASQEKLDSLFAQSTAFVLPSRFDLSPISYMEAASAGLPVITTTEGGAGELLGRAGLSVGPDDHAGLVSAMLRLADPTTARRMGAAASIAAAEATWAHVAERILNTMGLAAPIPAGATRAGH